MWNFFKKSNIYNQEAGADQKFGSVQEAHLRTAPARQYDIIGLVNVQSAKLNWVWHNWPTKKVRRISASKEKNRPKRILPKTAQVINISHNRTEESSLSKKTSVESDPSNGRLEYCSPLKNGRSWESSIKQDRSDFVENLNNQISL